MPQDFFSCASAVIIVRDAAATLPTVLQALSDFDEVVIYDNGSQDQSMDIARSFPNVSLYQGDFLGFGASKNYAASLARHDWIFSLDADERPDAALLTALRAWSLEDPHAIGQLRRLNYFCGKAIRSNGWGHDELLRVYHRRQHAFSDRLVHESLQSGTQSHIVKLSGLLHHDAYRDVGQMLDKAQHYSELYARSPQAKRYSFGVIVLKTAFAFFRSYLLKGGVCNGWRGFAIAFGEMIGVFFKYLKVYQRTGSS